MPKRKTGISGPENEATTMAERGAWTAARLRSESLLSDVEKLHSYLHGGGFGDPSIINNVWEHVDAIRYHMNGAISIRVARYETERRQKKAKTKEKTR